MKIKLPSGIDIKIFSPLYFILSKIEAYLSRGQNDFRTSKDFEDIVTILDGLNERSSILNTSIEIRNYLREKVSNFQKQDTFLESIYGHLEPGVIGQKRAKMIINFFHLVCST